MYGAVTVYFVYFLRSISNPDKTYIGYTKCLVDRLAQHNTGQSTYTRSYMPWRVEAFLLADKEATAIEAERYFKSPSGQEKFDPYRGQENPYEAFFSTLQVGRKFGRSRFEVTGNNFVSVGR